MRPNKKSAGRHALAGQLFLATAATMSVLQTATADAQNTGLTIHPVTIQLTSRERAAVLTVENHTGDDTTFQVRAFSWSQQNGSERLLPTDVLLVSPPFGKVPAGGSQTVRLVLRHAAQDREDTYRILLDQIQSAPTPGAINFVLRLSIPVFSEPAAHVTPHLQWSIERSYLVAVNNGGSHDAIRAIEISTPDGHALKLGQNISPYVLSGATRRWQILTPNLLASSSAPLRLKADADSGAIDQAVTVRSAPP